MDILSPDTPEDIYPVPYARRRVENCLPLNKAQREVLAAEGIRTMSQVDTWLARGGTWESLRGFGAVSAQKVKLAHASLLETRR